MPYKKLSLGKIPKRIRQESRNPAVPMPTRRYRDDGSELTTSTSYIERFPYPNLGFWISVEIQWTLYDSSVTWPTIDAEHDMRSPANWRHNCYEELIRDASYKSCKVSMTANDISLVTRMRTQDKRSGLQSQEGPFPGRGGRSSIADIIED